MKTNRHPMDYEYDQPIISQPVRICKDCGGNVYPLIQSPHDFTCIKCFGNNWEWVQEKDAAEYREQVRIRDETVSEVKAMLDNLLDAMEAIDTTDGDVAPSPVLLPEPPLQRTIKTFAAVDVTKYFGGIKATASDTWAKRHLNDSE